MHGRWAFTIAISHAVAAAAATAAAAAEATTAAEAQTVQQVKVIDTSVKEAADEENAEPEAPGGKDSKKEEARPKAK